jgi:NADH-quinone oxidoreductase subunit D
VVWHDDAVLTDLLLGVGMAAHLPCDEALTLAEHHPANHPGFQLRVTFDGDVVVEADPRIGLMHRSAEKLFEARDFRQAMLLANRHDWLSAFTSELGVALTIESALGLTPPVRATWIRTLLAEANRMSASLAFLAPVAREMRVPLETLRERFADLQEYVTGGRVHPGFARIGGVVRPIDDVGLTDYVQMAASVDAALTGVRDAIGSYAESLTGVAAVNSADALAWGLSGTVGRASGLDFDLRRDDPYLCYGDLRDLLVVPPRSTGDVPARYAAMIDQLPVSAAIVRACVDELRRLGDGPVDVTLPKVVRLPEGVSYAWVEGPLGISGCLIASVGDRSPWRMKIRSASFATMQVLGPALTGTRRADLADAVMSFPFVLGDVDR